MTLIIPVFFDVVYLCAIALLSQHIVDKTPRFTEDYIFIGGVIGSCLLRSTDIDDLKWARDHGFYTSGEMIKWPGHAIRVDAEKISSTIPLKKQKKARQLLRHYSYTNKEMHADLIDFGSEPQSVALFLAKWRFLFTSDGRRRWALKYLSSDILRHIPDTYFSSKVHEENPYSMTKESAAAAATIQAYTEPFFDHVKNIKTVFVPFIPPRSGFGTTPNGDSVTIAFGPGLCRDDHIMTIWHELLHFPVHKAMGRAASYNSKLAHLKDCQASYIEENIVAVLTDFLCPSAKPRPNMHFDIIIDRFVKKTKCSGDHMNLEALLNAMTQDIPGGFIP